MKIKCIIVFLFLCATSAAWGMDNSLGYRLEQEMETNRERLCDSLRLCYEEDNNARSCKYQKNSMQENAMQRNFGPGYFNTQIMSDIEHAIEKTKLFKCAIVYDTNTYVYGDKGLVKATAPEIMQVDVFILYMLPGADDKERVNIINKAKEIVATLKKKIFLYIPDEEWNPPVFEGVQSRKPERYALPTDLLFIGGFVVLVGLLDYLEWI